MGRAYTIDFNSMQQINEDTGTARPVQRKVNPLVAGCLHSACECFFFFSPFLNSFQYLQFNAKFLIETVFFYRNFHKLSKSILVKIWTCRSIQNFILTKIVFQPLPLIQMWSSVIPEKKSSKKTQILLLHSFRLYLQYYMKSTVPQ